MPKIRSLVLALSLIGCLPASAQQANLNYLGTQSSSVVSPSNSSVAAAGIAATFTNIATGQSGRQSCWLQYKPATSIPAVSVTNQGFVFFGTTAPATLTSSFVLNVFAILNCEQANEVEGNGIWVSSTATGDIFTIKVK